MERKHIKHSFVGFPHIVTPLQNIFHKECSEANLCVNTDVLQFFSGLERELIGEMITGACALSRHRRSDNVTAEDLLCHLDTQWKVDPLLISENCYRVEETTKKVDHSLRTEPLPKQRRMKRCSNTKKTIAKVGKISARKLKEMEEREAQKRTLEICRWFLYKLPLPFPMKKKSELKAEEHTSNDIMSRPDIIEFFGKKHKRYSFDSGPKPSPVAPTCKSDSKGDKKSSICDHTIKVHPSKGRTGLGFKMQKPDPESLTIKMYGGKQDIADAMSEQTPETSTYKQKSKVDEKMSTSDPSIKNFRFKKKMEHESKVAKKPSIKIPSCRDKLMVRLPATEGKQEVSGFLRLSPKAPMCKLKSKIEEKRFTCHSKNAFPFSEKTEHDLKVLKQPPIQTQATKVSDKKWKQEVPCVNYASVETTEIEKQPSIEIPSADLLVPKISGKKRKRNRFDINAVPGETPEAARKRRAIVLLRIAGKYKKYPSKLHTTHPKNNFQIGNKDLLS